MIKTIKWLLFHNKWESSKKYCPQCGNTKLGEMATLNLKVCQDCIPNHWFEWKLDKNQKHRL